MKPASMGRPLARAKLTLVSRSKGWLTYESVVRGAEGDVYQVKLRDRGEAPARVTLTIDAEDR